MNEPEKPEKPAITMDATLTAEQVRLAVREHLKRTGYEVVGDVSMCPDGSATARVTRVVRARKAKAETPAA